MADEQRGIENEGTGSLRVPEQKDRRGIVDPSTEVAGESEMSEDRQGGSVFSEVGILGRDGVGIAVR